MDTQHSIGQLAQPDARRDAVHIAVAPIVTAHAMWPGTVVGLNAKGEAVEEGYGVAAIGIVDPFLPRTHKILAGQRCWLLLFPNTITSLRHEWEHPLFHMGIEEELTPQSWLTRFAMAHDLSYDELLAMLERYVTRGIEGHLGVDIDYDAIPEMWRQYTLLTGRAVERSTTPFRCAC